MPELTTISDAERRRIVHEFVDETVGDAHPEVVAMVRDLTHRVHDTVELARAAGIAPESARAAHVVAAVVAAYGEVFDRVDDAGYRSALLARLEIANDPRTERYFELLATVNGWTPPPTLTPVLNWLITALTHHPTP
ncbi:MULTISPECIES: hypothetical protein [Micromonospora]|uniref:hypothetical protein n=1 Tax=Micromonospora TaxID=1873 RepID=UPI000B5B08B4|nr:MULTISPECIES: hypothetical protein [Micromonospora]WFE64963.1 hypothetical protein O7625_17555 [Micromonospora sp. WMMD714]